MFIQTSKKPFKSKKQNVTRKIERLRLLFSTKISQTLFRETILPAFRYPSITHLLTLLSIFEQLQYSAKRFLSPKNHRFIPVACTSAGYTRKAPSLSSQCPSVGLADQVHSGRIRTEWYTLRRRHRCVQCGPFCLLDALK